MSQLFPIAPLEKITDKDCQELSKCLWKWQLCGNCSGKEACTNQSCPWNRKDMVRSYLARYARLTSSYVPEYFAARQALSRHKDLLDIMQLVKGNPDKTKSWMMQQVFKTAIDPKNAPAVADQERAFNLAASVLLSVNCGMSDGYADQIEDCILSLPWNSDLSINALIAIAFPSRAVISGHLAPSSVDPGALHGLTVKHLRQKAGLQFEATDNLHCHLRLDPKSRVVYIFDDTAVLEEMLSASINDPDWCLIPRELMIEILHTIYKILFPPGRESQVILSSLVKKGGFDKYMLRYTIEQLRRDDDPEVDYRYFGVRLAELHNELKDPSPRNWFERLFEGGTKSAERKMLMATTIGVFIAVTIGLLGLGVAGFQAWVDYQQWKHPVKYP